MCFFFVFFIQCKEIIFKSQLLKHEAFACVNACVKYLCIHLFYDMWLWQLDNGTTQLLVLFELHIFVTPHMNFPLICQKPTKHEKLEKEKQKKKKERKADAFHRTWKKNFFFFSFFFFFFPREKNVENFKKIVNNVDLNIPKFFLLFFLCFCFLLFICGSHANLAGVFWLMNKVWCNSVVVASHVLIYC